MKNKRTLHLAGLFLGVASLAVAQHHSISATTPVDLGTLGGSASQANAVNRAGGVVGFANLEADAAQHGFLKRPDHGQLQDLGVLPGGINSAATAVNAFDVVAGYSDYDDPVNGIVNHGFLYNSGALHDIGTLGGASSQLTALNDFGFAAGFSLLSDQATTHAVLYRAKTAELIDLGVLQGGSNSAAYGINDLGFVAGSSETGAVDSFGAPIVDAVVFIPEFHTIVDLGNLGASPAQATAISDFGLVVGFSNGTDGNVHGFFWNGKSLAEVGSLGGSYTQATAVNNRGEVVGFSNVSGDADTHAFFWTASTGTVDLNSLLPANSGWDLNAAYGVNDKAEVVGVGTINGESHAFSLKVRVH